MTNTLQNVFATTKQEKRAAFIPYVMLGYPNEAASLAIAQAMADAGADIIELGAPFSDPLADGATIQKASQRALENGMTLRKYFQMAEQIARKTNIPLVMMGYYNPLLRMGLDEAMRSAANSGICGCITPDLPVEESLAVISAGKPYTIAPIFLAAPSSSDRRLKAIGAAAQEADSGFIYCVSLNGVTGARAALAEDLPQFMQRVHVAAPNIPLCVGFGISKPKHASLAARYADGVIVGSALMNAYDEVGATDTAAGVKSAEILARRMRAAAVTQ